MSIDLASMTDRNGYLEGDAVAVGREVVQRALDYKRRVSGSFTPVALDQVEGKLVGSDFCVTYKFDGELQMVFIEGDTVFSVNSAGRVRYGLACFEEARERVAASGVQRAILAAELYADESAGRTRNYVVSSALGSAGDRDVLRLGFFDIIEIDRTPFSPRHYRETHARLLELFGDAHRVGAVPMKPAGSRYDVLEIAEDWIAAGAEGVVVHSELSRIFKIKPKHSIDAAVVGYTEGDGDQRGKLRELLVAVRRDDGGFQVIGCTGNGLSENEKSLLFQTLSACHAQSRYLETDSRNIAFHMVRPEMVIELTCTDLITETSKGIKQNAVLTFDGDAGYRLTAMLPGVSLLHPMFVRSREDKTPDPSMVHIRQLATLVPLPEPSGEGRQTDLPASEMIFRKVYVKESKGQKMVQKFLAWRTNKESASFPAFVFHYTNFSPARKDALQREIRVSSSHDQLTAIVNSYLDANVKKGWEPADT
jgi:ATP-dependent DNA ligase